MTEESIRDEIKYCDALNRVLPKEIRCIAWQPLYSRHFSARFDCRRRTYRYFFPRSNFDIEAMRKACQYLIGVHDFRNLCKMDVANGVVAFERRLQEVKVANAHGYDDQASQSNPYAMMYVQLTGKAFLWHQVRAIMAVLLLVGEGKEAPEVIQDLLDVEKNPCTPQYSLASDLPLNLFQVDMEEYTKCGNSTDESPVETIGWLYDEFSLQRVISTLQRQWTKFNIRSQMTREMLHVLEGILDEKFSGERVFDHSLAIQEGFQPKRYQKLLTRNKCSKQYLIDSSQSMHQCRQFILKHFPFYVIGSLKHRIEHYAKKRRIEVSNGNSEESPTSPKNDTHNIS